MKHGEIKNGRALPLLIQYFFCLIVITNLNGVTFGQSNFNQSGSGPRVLIAWKPQAGVRKYRLQIARDRSFSDVLYDGLVTGPHYSTEAFTPGTYYWHVAPANFETGKFEETARLEIRERGAAIGVPVGFTARPLSSWQAATGEVRQSLATSSIVLAVNSAGTVFALDSASGVASWTSGPSIVKLARDSTLLAFVPPNRNHESKVVAAFDGGIRILSSATGRELGRIDLRQRFAGGVSDSESSSFYALGNRPNELIVFDTDSKKVTNRIGLSSAPIGAPLLLDRNHQRQIVLTLEKGLEVRSSNGNLERTIKIDSGITTAAVLVTYGNRLLIVVGTRQGLLAIDVTNFVTSRAIPIGGNPTSALAVANIDDDPQPEVVLISNQRRVMSVDAFNGKIKWTADEGGFAEGVAFADVDGDSVLDVLVPGEKNFARGLSGRDGIVVWETPEERAGGAIGPRQLIVVTTRSGKKLLVGPDLARVGLRGIELPRPTATAKMR